MSICKYTPNLQTSTIEDLKLKTLEIYRVNRLGRTDLDFDFVGIQRLEKRSVDRLAGVLFFFNSLITVEGLIPKTRAVSRIPLPLRAISMIFCFTSGKRPG